MKRPWTEIFPMTQIVFCECADIEPRAPLFFRKARTNFLHDQRGNLGRTILTGLVVELLLHPLAHPVAAGLSLLPSAVPCSCGASLRSFPLDRDANMIATGSPWFSIAFRSPPNGFSAAPGSSWYSFPASIRQLVRLGKKCVSLIRLADKSRTDTSKVQQRIPMDAEGKEIDDFTALGRGSRLWLQSGSALFLMDLSKSS